MIRLMLQCALLGLLLPGGGSAEAQPAASVSAFADTARRDTLTFAKSLEVEKPPMEERMLVFGVGMLLLVGTTALLIRLLANGEQSSVK